MTKRPHNAQERIHNARRTSLETQRLRPDQHNASRHPRSAIDEKASYARIAHQLGNCGRTSIAVLRNGHSRSDQPPYSTSYGCRTHNARPSSLCDTRIQLSPPIARLTPRASAARLRSALQYQAPVNPIRSVAGLIVTGPIRFTNAPDATYSDRICATLGRLHPAPTPEQYATA